MGFWGEIWSFIAEGLAVVPHEKRQTVLARTPPPELEVPTSEEGTTIPWVSGRVNIPNLMLLWYGDLHIDSQSNPPFNKYLLTMQYGVCWGPVSVIRHQFDGRVLFPGWIFGEPLAHDNDTGYRYPDLFGGDGDEGGIDGAVKTYFGLQTAADSTLEAKVGKNLPAYTGLCYQVLHDFYTPDGFYVGTTGRLKPYSCEVICWPNELGMTSNKHKIRDDAQYPWNAEANPACTLYQWMTDQMQGLGISSGLIDVDSFREAGLTLWDEGFGLSPGLFDAREGSEYIQQLLRHIDGMLYPDPSTGKITLKLVRGDYDPDDLVTLDESCIRSLEFERRLPSESFNETVIAYTARDEGYRRKTVPGQDLASIEASGGEIRSRTLDFLWATTPGVAQMILARELKSGSSSPGQMSLTCNRKAWSLRPGKRFKLNWPPLGIVGMVCLIARMGTGDLKSGEITIEAAEDIFGIDWTAYVPPPISGWEDPWTPPPPPA